MRYFMSSLFFELLSSSLTTDLF